MGCQTLRQLKSDVDSGSGLSVGGSPGHQQGMTDARRTEHEVCLNGL
jgi:hypothetical protein